MSAGRAERSEDDQAVLSTLQGREHEPLRESEVGWVKLWKEGRQAREVTNNTAGVRAPIQYVSSSLAFRQPDLAIET